MSNEVTGNDQPSTKISKKKLKLLDLILSIYHQMYDSLSREQIPEIKVGKRSKDNIVYDEDHKVYVLADKFITKTAKTVGGSRQLLLLIHTFNFLIHQMRLGKSCTLREMYYISEGWEGTKFETQNESNYLIQNLELLTNHSRDNFNIYPETNGHMVGDMIIQEKTRHGTRRVHCQYDVNEAGYVIPFDMDSVKIIQCKAKFIIALESGGTFRRLVENNFDKDYNAILINCEGQASRATRKMINRVNKDFGLNVGVFTDADPWSSRIFASIKWGSIKTAHLSTELATPDAKLIGLRFSDILKYELPHDKLKPADLEALKDLLSDPRFEEDEWKVEILAQIEKGIKAEQQSLAKYGLDFVTQVYLPTRLKELGFIPN